MNVKKNKVALHNLGCKVNSYETDAMSQAMADAGYEIVPFEPGADIYIINTCTVTNIADRKSRQMLHKAKKMNKDAIVVAVGCYVQAAGEELLKDEAIDIIVGTNNKSEIVDIIEKYIEDKNIKKSYLKDISKNAEYEDMDMTTVTEHTRAFIKIQDGCNQFCTYCIIPYSRGRIRSRKLENIYREISELVDNGYQEFVLTGIHLSSYGKDFKDDVSLYDAIKCVSEIDGVKRIRLGSLEQGIITEEFIKKMKDIPQFCPHFHLSLQSGCEETLKRMNRRYTPDEYFEKCCIIRNNFENPAITTDVIVGFPEETDDEFEKTKKFLEKVDFSEMHIFKYSMRKGTVAAQNKNQVNMKVKNVRSDELIKLNEKLSEKYKNKFVGMKKEILFEEEVEINGEKYFVGHTREYLKVAVKSDIDLSNKILFVKIKSLLNKEILLAELE